MQDQNQSIIIANWKMNISLSEATDFITSLSNNQYHHNAIICPNFLLLDRLINLCKNTHLFFGAQDISSLNDKFGAFTGDISGYMIKDIGARYVICGHSERRKFHLETNEVVKIKATNAIKNNLIPIICIGESLENRQNSSYKSLIKEQLLNSIPEESNANNIIIAYEPIWAIGTGLTANSEQIAEIHEYIYECLITIKSFEKNVKIVYGGSVNKSNAEEILMSKYVSGLLIGGASLDVTHFSSILEIAKSINS